MPTAFDKELRSALTAVRQAADVCARVQARITPDVLEKDDRSPVTVADFASQAIVCRILSDAFPEDPIIAEEDSAFLQAPENKGFLETVRQELVIGNDHPTVEQVCSWIDRGGANRASSRFWTLDPIDGTKGFLRKDQYAVSLALVIDGQIQIGILGCPNLAVDGEETGGSGAVLYAVRGAGARIESLEKSSTSASIRVSGTSSPAAARMCESVESGHSSHDHSRKIAHRLGLTGEPVRIDSQAKYAVVARGDADMYLRLPTRKSYREKIWDHAGGVLIVEEAGGTVTDVHGRPLDFSLGSELQSNEGVVVTNGHLHDRVLDTVQSVLGLR